MTSLAGESSKHRPHPRLWKMGWKGKVRSLRARVQPETQERPGWKSRAGRTYGNGEKMTVFHLTSPSCGPSLAKQSCRLLSATWSSHPLTNTPPPLQALAQATGPPQTLWHPSSKGQVHQALKWLCS